MSDRAIETLLDEERRFPPDPAFAAQANAQPEIYEVDPDTFWEREGRERVSWFTPFETLSEWELPFAKWFLGGTLNVAYNCVDRHVEAGLGERVAYHWEGEPGETRTITYAELQGDVVQMANRLKEAGVEKGTPVAIYMGMVPELPVAMLACTRLGAPAHGGVRGVLRRLAVGADGRHGLRGPGHPGRGLAARQARPPEGDRGRGDGRGTTGALLPRAPPDGKRRPDAGGT